MKEIIEDEYIGINIVGDFFVPNLQNHKFGQQISAQLAKADINVINLEGPLRTTGTFPAHKSGPHLCQDPNIPSFLESNHFNVISISNNHIMDYGERALQYTKDSFVVKMIGAGVFDEVYSIKIVSKKGVIIGFLPISQYEFGVLTEKTQTNTKGTAWMCHPLIDELIASAHSICDILIVLPHAGCEMFDLPLPEIKELYRHFIRMGADAVIGAHPHVPQCWEVYKEKPIAYSLGNFCFDFEDEKSIYWNIGLLAHLKIKEKNIQMTIDPISYNKSTKVVDFVNDFIINKHLNDLNLKLDNENEYISQVNDMCLKKELEFLDLFELSGFVRPNIKKSAKIILSHLKRSYITHKPFIYDDSHFINNIRCEAHRWMLSRIYELKNSTKNK